MVTEPIPHVLRQIAADSGTALKDIERCYYQQLYFDLWSGALPESEFWAALGRYAGGTTAQAASWQRLFVESLLPLPALQRVAEWSTQVVVIILSNHLPHWLEPLLSRAGVLRHVNRLLISARTGLVKPNPQAFTQAIEGFDALGESVLVVDDNPANLAAAAELGLVTLLADAEGTWCNTVSELISVRNKADEPSQVAAELSTRTEAATTAEGS